MTAKEKLYKILYLSLIDIRYDSIEINNNKIYAISNALHTIPLKLLNVEKESQYEDILAEYIATHKENKGLMNIVKQVENLR